MTPPSSERNRPCGEVPAYQTPGSLAWPGVSQKVWSTLRPLPSCLLRERGRLLRFLPGPAEVGGPEDRRSEVPGLRGGEQRAAVARIEHQVVNDVTEEVRAVGAPAAARRIAVEDPCALARGDQHREPARDSRPRSRRYLGCGAASVVADRGLVAMSPPRFRNGTATIGGSAAVSSTCDESALRTGGRPCGAAAPRNFVQLRRAGRTGVRGAAHGDRAITCRAAAG